MSSGKRAQLKAATIQLKPLLTHKYKTLAKSYTWTMLFMIAYEFQQVDVHSYNKIHWESTARHLQTDYRCACDR